MSDDGEKFVSRWSRLKREARERVHNPPVEKPPAAAGPQDAPPEVPPIDQLTFDSDYRGFFHPKIDEDTRRAALKKLFSDPRFNVIDEMDIDIEDYSKYPPLSATVVASLKQTQNILQWAREREEEEKRRREEQTRLAQGKEDPEPTEYERGQSATGDLPAAQPGDGAGKPVDDLPGVPVAENKKA